MKKTLLGLVALVGFAAWGASLPDETQIVNSQYDEVLNTQLELGEYGDLELLLEEDRVVPVSVTENIKPVDVVDTSDVNTYHSSSNNSSSSGVTNYPIPSPAQASADNGKSEERFESSTNNLSNDNYYTNVDGNRVKSPAHSLDGSVPAGASARCRNGSYSFSQNRRGTCSGNGGVAVWY